MTQAVSSILLLLILAAFPAGADSTPVPVGDELQVNTYTTGFQSGSDVSADADGAFVVVWESYGSSGSDSSLSSIQGQRFDSAGTFVGDQFQINTYTPLEQLEPAVAVDAGGDFVVVWGSYGSSGSDSSNWSIQGQRFDSAGAQVGDQFQVNTYTTSTQVNPAVAADADGDFVVVWRSHGSSGSDSSSSSVQGQRFDSAGAPVGNQFQINTYTTDSQFLPAVVADADGASVVVWESYGSSGSDSSRFSIQGQRFDSAGVQVGGEFQVNSYTTDSQRSPAVVVDAGGDFVVVWNSVGSSGSDSSLHSIQGQRFDSTGAPVGDQFQVNTYTTADQERPAVVADAHGDFVAVWGSDGSSGSDSSYSSVQGQRFDSAGAPVGDEFQVNTFIVYSQLLPSAAADAEGDFVVVWSSGGSSGSDSSSYSIQGQRFTVPIFADGFESGDTSAWSNTVP